MSDVETTIKELDVVRLADGRIGTIVCVLDPGNAYLFEGEHSEETDEDATRVIAHEDIASV